MGSMPSFAKVICSTIPLSRFPRVVRGTTTPLVPCGPERMSHPVLRPKPVAQRLYAQDQVVIHTARM
jgi:hypothetical protein